MHLHLMMMDGGYKWTPCISGRGSSKGGSEPTLQAVAPVQATPNTSRRSLLGHAREMVIFCAVSPSDWVRTLLILVGELNRVLDHLQAIVRGLRGGKACNSARLQSMKLGEIS